MTSQPNTSAQWAKIQKAGLCSGIKSFADYTVRYLAQLEEAIDSSVERACLVPGPSDLAAFHNIVFKDIHPWAGEFRKLGQAVTFDGSTPGADAHRIGPALQSLKEETEASLAQAPSDQAKVILISSYLGGVRRIHPFLDGNTRTSVVVLYGQVTALFGKKERPALASLEFKGMLKNAYEGHVGFLANCILKEGNLPAIIGQAAEAGKVPPSLDADLETAWQDERERILERQKYGKLGRKDGPPLNPPPNVDKSKIHPPQLSLKNLMVIKAE
jgi:hypothetical protein